MNSAIQFRIEESIGVLLINRPERRNALDWAAQIEAAALQIIAASSVGEIGPYVETLTQLSPLLLNGADSNGDGEVGPAEGGIFTAYQHAQYMGAVPVFLVISDR